jgi:hypothetical protein
MVPVVSDPAAPWCGHTGNGHDIRESNEHYCDQPVVPHTATCRRDAGKDHLDPCKMMTMTSQLNALCDLLRKQTKVSVVLGRPNEKARAIYVWPWRILPVAESRAPTRAPSIPPVPALPSQPMDIRFLLIATPTLGQKGLDSLDLARQILIDNPVLDAPGARLTVTPDSSLSSSELAAFFTAAKLPLTICAEFSMRSSAAHP